MCERIPLNMDWPAEDMDRLYDLYQRHFERLREDVVKANLALGAAAPTMRLARLDRPEFESLLRSRHRDPEAVRLWIRQIVRGHEQEFPRLEVA